MRSSATLAALAFTAAAALAGFAPLARADAPARAVPVDAKAAPAKAPSSFASKPAEGTKARCPVSGDEFVIKKSTQTTTHNGRVYAFCCPDCKPDFEKNPAKYIDKEKK